MAAVVRHRVLWRRAETNFRNMTLGEANVRRIYGGFSGTRLKSWNDAIKTLAILQHQQRSNSTGKNASDIALVIDAMDLMHKGTHDGFCLVSSDSDFTRPAQRLREEGVVVYGFGERKAVEAFRNACNRFIYVENLEEAGVEKDGAGDSPAASQLKKEPPSKAVKIIARAIESADEDGWANLGGVGSRIQGANPDFDARTYGCRIFERGSGKVRRVRNPEGTGRRLCPPQDPKPQEVRLNEGGRPVNSAGFSVDE